ncbi:MAG: hypothetical protein ACJ8C4_17205 [Gemmataceae bacterium]
MTGGIGVGAGTGAGIGVIDGVGAGNGGTSMLGGAGIGNGGLAPPVSEVKPPGIGMLLRDKLSGIFPADCGVPGPGVAGDAEGPEPGVVEKLTGCILPLSAGDLPGVAVAGCFVIADA